MTLRPQRRPRLWAPRTPRRRFKALDESDIWLHGRGAALRAAAQRCLRLRWRTDAVPAWPAPGRTPGDAARRRAFGMAAPQIKEPGAACRRSRAAGGAGHAHRRACSRTEERSEEHTSELQSQSNLVCRLLLEKKKK